MFRELLEYCKEADQRLIEVFKNSKTNSPKALTLFSHVLNAQHIWASRILKRAQVFPFTHVHLLNDFDNVCEQNFQLFLEVLDKVSLEEKISYTNSTGNNYTSDVKDILFHVVNHSTHHRGQIMMLFRDRGIEPPVTDYIFLKREQNQ